MSAPRIILASLPSFCQKLSKLVELWRSSDQNNFAVFWDTGWNRPTRNTSNCRPWKRQPTLTDDSASICRLYWRNSEPTIKTTTFFVYFQFQTQNTALLLISVNNTLLYLFCRAQFARAQSAALWDCCCFDNMITARNVIQRLKLNSPIFLRHLVYHIINSYAENILHSMMKFQPTTGYTICR